MTQDEFLVISFFFKPKITLVILAIPFLQGLELGTVCILLSKYFIGLVTLTDLDKRGTYKCVFSTSLCCVDSGCCYTTLESVILGNEMRLLCEKQNSNLCMVTDSCTFFLKLCLLLEAKMWVWFSKKQKPMQSNKNDLFIFCYKSKDTEILLMSFCASLISILKNLITAFWRIQLNSVLVSWNRKKEK